MDRRNFLTLPLAALAVPVLLLAANAGSAVAAPVSGRVPAAAAAPKALKGFGHGGKDALALRQIQGLNLDWYYAWRSRSTVTYNPGFVPMVRDAKTLLKENAIRYVREELSKTKTTHLLGFNEPDLAGQADMSVEDAIRLWPQLEASGLRLGGPATIKPNAVWLDKFMIKAERAGLRIDFMPMHCYGWPDSEDFLEKVEKLHKKYQRPVWVTEYAVADWDVTATRKNEYTRKQVETFMRETVAGMRAMPYVERFAWKTRAIDDRYMGTSALFDDKGNMTSTGRLYASL